MAKVSRRLTIKISPISKGNFAMTFEDGKTRSEDGRRLNESVLTADSFSKGAVPEAFAESFKAFEKSLQDEDAGELFADKKPTGKPKIDGE